MSIQTGECFHILDEVLRIDDEFWVVGRYLMHCVDNEMIADKKISYMKTEISDDKLDITIYLRVIQLHHRANHEYFSLPQPISLSSTLRFIFMDDNRNIMKDCSYSIHKSSVNDTLKLDLVK